MKKQLRYGFTLVELLVVISIIGMLAGLLLPAVNAARESGRRIVCVNNQGQLSIAMINYDGTRGNLPPMRGAVYAAGGSGQDRRADYASWVVFLFPYMEENAAWDRASGGQKPNAHDAASNIGILALRTYGLPSLKCKSANLETQGPSMSYVVNGGYQNGYSSDHATVTGSGTSFEIGKKEDAPFFDHWLNTIATSTLNTTTCSIDYISANDGTSSTLLLSENLQAGDWYTSDFMDSTKGYSNAATLRRFSHAEDQIAYCFPVNKTSSSPDLTDPAVIAKTSGPLATIGYDADTDTATANVSWKGYTNAPLVIPTTGDIPGQSPLFINQGRAYPAGKFATRYRCARPSSNHPGTVVAAFADRSVRTLNDQMDAKTFVLLNMPKSQQVIDMTTF